MSFFFCSVIFAQPADRVERLTSKVILQNTEGYFVLSDGSCWKVIGFSTRWRTISEWWNNIQLAPGTYNCVPNDWCLGTQIEVYSKFDNLAVSESNASNEEELKKCSHLLFNSITRQVIFAMPLEPERCIVSLFNDARDEGYNLGYAQGVAESSYKYLKGYNDGYAQGKNESSYNYQYDYNDGYSAGYNEGYMKAYNELN